LLQPTPTSLGLRAIEVLKALGMISTTGLGEPDVAQHLGVMRQGTGYVLIQSKIASSTCEAALFFYCTRPGAVPTVRSSCRLLLSPLPRVLNLSKLSTRFLR
jgi:hypothetical protein